MNRRPTIDPKLEALPVFAEVQPDVRAELERFGLVTLFGEDAFFETAADVIAAYQREAPAV